MSTKDPHPVDIHVGTMLRRQRCAVGMTQTALAQSVDITFQQLQKYETATNRISASRLWEFAGVLAVPVEAFFPRGHDCDAPDSLLVEWMTLYECASRPQQQWLVRIIQAVMGSGHSLE